MKFFAAVFTFLGILLILAGIFGAPNAYQFAYIPDPAAPNIPGTPLLTGNPDYRPYSSFAANFTIYYVVGTILLGILFIGQGVLYYTVGEINEKMDILLTHD
jgi:uncharacterized membrane protein HdeD (DUF308 family)